MNYADLVKKWKSKESESKKISDKTLNEKDPFLLIKSLTELEVALKELTDITNEIINSNDFNYLKNKKLFDNFLIANNNYISETQKALKKLSQEILN